MDLRIVTKNIVSKRDWTMWLKFAKCLRFDSQNLFGGLIGPLKKHKNIHLKKIDTYWAISP